MDVVPFIRLRNTGMRPDFKEKTMGLGFIHFEFEINTKCGIEYMTMLLSGDKV